jgi:predicted MFS family arabinose efflux permease
MAGSICGGAAGAMLADRIGYYPVFLVGAVIVFSVIAYTIVFLRRALRRPAYYSSEPPTESVNKRQVFEFFFNRNVFSVILLSAFPGAVAVVGFLYYFSPVYLNRIGTSQSTIGRILMIYGICLIYLGPFVSKYADRSSNKKTYVVVSGILGSLGFVIFWLIEGPIATALAILLLGLSSSFGVSRRSYILKLEISRKLGPGTAMGLFNSAMRAGQVLGPIMFGWLIVTAEVSKGITYFGLAYLFITFIFLVSAQSDRTIIVNERLKTGRPQL